MGHTVHKIMQGRFRVYSAGKELGEVNSPQSAWWYVEGSPHRYWTRKDAINALVGGTWTQFVHVQQEERVEESKLDKVFKLVQGMLNTNGRTSEETATFAAKASALMFQYNISEEDVKAGPRDQASEFENRIYDPDSGYAWVRTLAHVLGRVSFVQVVKRVDGKLGLVGQKHNVTFVCWMFEYLRGQVDRLIEEAYHARHLRYNRTFKSDFGAGCVSTVWHRLQEAYGQQVDQASPSSQALVVVKSEDLKTAVHHYYPILKNEQRDSVRDGWARMAGQEAGHRVNIDRPLGVGRRAEVLA